MCLYTKFTVVKFQKRIKLGSVENLYSMLQWTGLVPDESPFCGGPYGSYVQVQDIFYCFIFKK